VGARSEWQALSHLSNCSAHTLYCPGPCGRPSRQRPWYWSPLGKYFVPAGVLRETVSTPSGWLHKRQERRTQAVLQVVLPRTLVPRAVWGREHTLAVHASRQELSLIARRAGPSVGAAPGSDAFAPVTFVQATVRP